MADKLAKIKEKIPVYTKTSPNAGKTKKVRAKPPSNLEYKKITPQIERFCKEYIVNLCNGTEAAMRSFPGITTRLSAANRASRLLNSENVQKRIEELKEQVEEATGVSKTFMVQELLDIANGQVEILETKEEFDNMPEARKKAVKKVEWQEHVDKEGTTHRSLKVEFYSKLECFKIIAEIMGYTQKQAANVIIQQNNLFGDAEKEFRKSIEI